MTYKTILIKCALIGLGLLGACSSSDTTNPQQEASELLASDKADGPALCELFGFEDDCDLCHEFELYGDGVCHLGCDGNDVDCNTSSCDFNGVAVALGEQGASPYDSCNTCTCEEQNGQLVAGSCTELFCAETGCQLPDGSTLAEGESIDSPNDSCNRCTCFEDGALLCTEIACAEVCETPDGTIHAGETIRSPYPNDACNTCTCQEDGVLSCTEALCAAEEPEFCAISEEIYLEVGDSIRSPFAGDSCNTCTCQEDGVLACTELLCATSNDSCVLPNGDTVANGERIQSPYPNDECNTCVCDGEGGYFACTEIACQ